MSNYVCTICGETASSKCVFRRNVFLSDQSATILASVADLKQGDNGHWIFTLDVVPGSRTATRDEAVKYIAECLRDVGHMAVHNDGATFRRAMCEHSWRLTAPTCELGCCKRDDSR